MTAQSQAEAEARTRRRHETEVDQGRVDRRDVVTCDKIDYFYKEKRAESAGNLKIVQKDRVDYPADAATYLGKDEIVKLTGNIQANDEKKKHTFSAPKVTISLKDDDEWMEAEERLGHVLRQRRGRTRGQAVMRLSAVRFPNIDPEHAADDLPAELAADRAGRALCEGLSHALALSPRSLSSGCLLGLFLSSLLGG